MYIFPVHINEGFVNANMDLETGGDTQAWGTRKRINCVTYLERFLPTGVGNALDVLHVQYV